MSGGLPIVIGMVEIAPDSYRDGRLENIIRNYAHFHPTHPLKLWEIKLMVNSPFSQNGQTS